MSAERSKRRHSARPRRRRGLWVGAGLAVVIAGGGVATFAAVHRAAATSGGGQPRAGATLAARATKTRARARRAVGQLRLVAIAPAPRAANVGYRPTIRVRFSQPLAASSPLPSLRPAVAGSWSRPRGTTIVFRPAGEIAPGTTETVTVPGGAAGVRGSSGGHFASTVAWRFTVAKASTLRLQQLLAELGYLPVRFIGPGSSLAAAPATPSAIPLAARPGRFAWRFAHVPSQLATLWQPGVWNTITEGAVMSFEFDHGLASDGIAGTAVWRSLLQAVAAHDATTRPYSYIITTETAPETLYVWSDGRVVYQSLANTGVAAAPTQLGTWPVYLRYLTTTMSGTNPDGSHYSDPGIPWVSYFNGGDAVHGFYRAQYGFPQSDGCVELPEANAKIVYPYDPIGTLVTVTTGDLASELAGGTAPPTTPTGPATTTTTTTATTATTTAPVRSVPPRRPTPATSATTATTTPVSAPTG